ncbi:MAG: c-type cytochrome [Thermoanaerobaculia bacterium]
MRFKTFILFVVAAVFVIAIGVALVIWRGAAARDEPSRAEVIVGRTLRHFAIPSAMRAAKNPIPLTPAVLADARAHWADHCAICHANDGSGNSEMGRNIYPRAPDMRTRETQKLSDGELYAIIRDGVRLTGMPAWGGDDRDNWKLVHFVRHLPKLRPEEIEAMERLNPKTPEEIEQMRREEEFLKGH